ncbi:hypothetical protein NIES37_14680 [Tolypothrix tenuis PCC 7101]|uniref:Uncharacterized protein n=1 Tax=Tolypothrix tenuis PCC 7101 TaxID=231146 RepID=A0A1Z4MVL9_9CYAN|nr:hypothetical protein NIES37_14680 [Tolypothrix tenuis PCC 7101]BAZ71964.1 hypothetical protein NIES50_05130 [Aulosira laxa NIES-50]
MLPIKFEILDFGLNIHNLRFKKVWLLDNSMKASKIICEINPKSKIDWLSYHHSSVKEYSPELKTGIGCGSCFTGVGGLISQLSLEWFCS